MESRSTKELLELLLQRQDLFVKGLCSWVILMHIDNQISFSEQCRLQNYIEKHPPLIYKLNIRAGYYWKVGEIKPRIKWINKHIKKLGR